ncbi:aldehyde dehydrogenase family protein [Wenzhouxiangella marina]|uniref:Aldehyde dehydrogenase n=1 Tax=Wenzhouxiangella marina TaxID=1579979 RepID=A0A0K0XUI3_9GAMM|nr:aldehyde dehydrogenase family protein [Wenzhouxiangella marina]AKS41282.1 aldehyde dehydrogenase [Wenzhouxiangella marina]MBB6086968.1 acyl-CoA reductase-like NAD-dependent aldehyde dehydrogenase [Wenzhouxiangella marina]
MSIPSYPYYLANRAVHANTDLAVEDKHSGEVAYRVAKADADALEQAIAAAERAAAPMAALPSHKRRDVLLHCVERFKARRDELAEVLVVEGGKVIKDARGEVQRLIETFQIAAEESTRVGGEVLPMDIAERTERWMGMTKKVPIGPVSLITPFNFPYNLVAHKVAPAIAAGCPFVLKPADKTPVGALLIGEILAECDLPEGAFSILPLDVEDAAPLTEDERLKLLSFTGSDKVGWMLKSKAGKKPVVMELGGNAACLVDADADLDDAVDRLVFGAFYQSGQSCISVQRVQVHESIYDELKARLVEKVTALKGGDPRDPETFIGPLITEQDAERVMDWIREATDQGAELLVGGERQGRIVTPAVLEKVGRECKLYNQEVFGPVMVLEPFSDFDAALETINDSRYGLQAGLFVRDIGKIRKAWDRLDVGGVIINDVPSFRVDHMPYGGVKDSGLGREGIKYAIEDMTEIRLLAIRGI